MVAGVVSMGRNAMGGGAGVCHRKAYILAKKQKKCDLFFMKYDILSRERRWS